MSSLRLVAVALVTLTAACFGQAPAGPAGAESSESTSGSPPPSTGESESSTIADTSSSSDGSSTDPSATGSEDSSGDAESGSDSTGEPSDCECPQEAVECASFEGDFDIHAPPWGVPGGTMPTIVDDPVRCGAAALRTACAAGELYSVASHSLPPALLEPGVHGIRAWVQINGKCTDVPTRVMQVQRSGPPPMSMFDYGIELFVDAEHLELRLQDAIGVPAPTAVPFALEQGVWYDIELEFDLSVSPPVVTVRVDGEPVLDAVEGPLASALTDEPRLATTLGIFQIVPFEQDCAAVYDDFSAR